MIRKHAAFALVATLGLAACQDNTEPTSPQAAAPAGGVQASKWDPDAVGRTLPSFGGAYLDEQGNPTVYLTNVADRGKAAVALAGFLSQTGKSAGQLRVKEGKFNYGQLSEYFGKAGVAHSLKGVVLSDLDEARNRVKVGVETVEAGQAARDALIRAGVPADAIIVEIAEPIHQAVTLRDVLRPIRSGMQINFGSYVCTLGFNVSHSAGSSFVTNSHCTNVQGGTEGTRYYQPSTALSAQVATEAADPAYTTGGSCPVGRRCRRSDSSRAAYLSGVSFERGRIARTGSRGSLTGSLTISTTSPYFTITAEGSAVVGTQVNKIGRTSGWTYGNVTATCANINVSGTSITQLCQNAVSAGVQGGDSGSAVFTWSGSGSNVTLVGLLWGGNSSNNQFIYSPLSQVEAELGALTTTF